MTREGGGGDGERVEVVVRGGVEMRLYDFKLTSVDTLPAICDLTPPVHIDWMCTYCTCMVVRI